jgi:hypothetical protein
LFGLDVEKLAFGIGSLGAEGDMESLLHLIGIAHLAGILGREGNGHSCCVELTDPAVSFCIISKPDFLIRPSIAGLVRT